MENISENATTRSSHSEPRASFEQRSKSLGSLITWNISKVLEKNPNLDLKRGIKAIQNRLENDTGYGNGVVSPHPEEQHLVCAMLAWQQLGHTGADSLYQFIESKRDQLQKCSKSIPNNEKNNFSTLTMASNSMSYSNDSSSRVMNSTSFGSYARYGPVVKLPVETKTVMRVDNISCKRESKKRRSDGQTSSKIRDACCMESTCAEKLARMDKATEEQRNRAAKLARREAERVDLLERAEAAWRDLEIGFQRRLSRAEEAEESLMRQIQKLFEERQNDKNACDKLAGSLKVIAEATEKEKNTLNTIEKDVCCFACTRLKLLEENARGEAALADQYCKTSQLDRDLQFKEEQARRKLQSMESETESARALSYEAERSLHAELGGLRDQIKQVSAQLLEEDAFNTGIKKELVVLRQDKKGMIEDIDGCKEKCDRKIQLQLDKLQQKRDELKELKEKVFDCKCKLPVDASVEAKRTPSLAAMCTCAPENRLLGTCSCTSLKSTLISTLLADLFNGLQSELGFTGGEMPCQLLKCLEDNHNWDRNSVVKTNLRNFFSQLLVGELDIAIATSIEKYHAKWVGASCADFGKFSAGPDDDTSKPDWEKCALEKRATKLAEKLAEQLFEKKAEELRKQAKEIITSGPPPCECSKMSKPTTFPCLLEVDTPFGGPRVSSYETGTSSPDSTCWKRTQRDVTQLRLQIADLKKESLKKEDLKLMEEKIAKIVKKAAGPECDDSITKESPLSTAKNNVRETITFKDIHQSNNESLKLANKSGIQKKKLSLASNYSKKSFMNDKPTKQPKKHTYHQSYAVNLCLCGPQNVKTMLQASQTKQEVKSCMQNPSQEVLHRATQSKPINVNCLYPENSLTSSKCSMEFDCGSQCQCFQKMPSNSSIDNLLQTLVKWKSDLGNQEDTLSRSNLANKSFLDKTTKSRKHKVLIDSKVLFSNNVQDIKTSSKMHEKEPVMNNNEMISFSQACNTASVYMAAISLDKSNELVSEYPIDSNVGDKQQEIYSNFTNECASRCLDSPTGELDKNVKFSDKPLSNDEFNKINVLNEHIYGKSTNTKNLNVLVNSECTKDINQQDNTSRLAKKDIVNQTECNVNRRNQSDAFQNEDGSRQKADLDYYIKFLGVTLTDTDSHNVLKNLEGDRYETENNTRLSQKYKDHEVEQRYLRIDPMPSIHQTTLQANECKDSTKTKQICECNANFEDFKRFMFNIVKKQFKKKNSQHKDIALDSQSFRCVPNSLENCVCCHHSNADNSKELEVNAFQLLEDYLRKKIKNLNNCACQSSCLPPAEEKEIFSSMLKKVKQVISDCANELSNERGCLATSGSWERAYGLLQEYLKIKMKRVQCLPFLKENKDVILPDILNKVCNLIETDFQRLKKNMCKCKNYDKMKEQKNTVTVTKQSLNRQEELPERDTNVANDASLNSMRSLTCQNALKHNVAISTNLKTKTLSCDDLTKNISISLIQTKHNLAQPISIKQNVSLQVPLGLGMETKSCDALQLDTKYDQTTISKSDNKNDTSEVVVFNDCDCCYNNYNYNKHKHKKLDNDVSQLLPNKDILEKLYADILSPHTFDRFSTKQETILQCSSLKPALKSKSLPNVDITSNVNDMIKQKTYNKSAHTYQSYTAYKEDGTLKDNLTSKKSEIQEIWKNWQQSNNRNISCNNEESNIKSALENKVSPKFIGHIDCSAPYKIRNYSEVLTNYKSMRGVETDIQDREQLVLIVSKHEIDAVHNTTNTVKDWGELGKPITNEDIYDIFEGTQTFKTGTTLSTDKFTDSACFYESIDDSEQYSQSVTTMDTENGKSSMICKCDKVPICHVKMLVDNIEKRIIKSECTCDSVYKICPVHTRNVNN